MMRDYLQSLRDRQHSSLWRVGHLLEREFFYHEDRRRREEQGTMLQYYYLLHGEDTLCAYFLLNAPEISPWCQELILYDEELIEGYTQFGKPDMIYADGKGGIACVEVKQPGSGNNARRKRHKVLEQTVRYQEQMRELCHLPQSAVRGIVFTDDIMLQTDGPAPLLPAGESYEGIYLPSDDITAWVEAWVARPAIESLLKGLLTKLRISPGNLVDRTLAQPSWEAGSDNHHFFWMVLYLDQLRHIPDYAALGEAIKESLAQ